MLRLVLCMPGIHPPFHPAPSGYRLQTRPWDLRCESLHIAYFVPTSLVCLPHRNSSPYAFG